MKALVYGTVLSSDKPNYYGHCKTVLKQGKDEPSTLTLFTKDQKTVGQEVSICCEIGIKVGDKRPYFVILEA